MGSITTPDFESNGVSYTVQAVAYNHEGLHLGLSKAFSTPFALHVDTKRFESSEASTSQGSESYIHTWSQPGLNWSEGDSVLVVFVEGKTSEAQDASTNSAATGVPTISGTLEAGQTLTASTSGISDADGLANATFSYQWVSNDGTTDTDIEGAASSTYILNAADEGKTVKVRVSFTDDAGNDESLTSTATDTVAVRANSPATGLPTIRGTAQVGETLTAETSAIADEDGLSNVAYNYQWLADDTDIARATGSSYTLADADEGKTVKVRVSFTDDGGNQESLTSAPTAMVPTPLTAGFQWMPGSHNGRDEFTIFIQFSEEIASSYVTLRDHALTVTGGEVVSADVFGYSDLWALGIDPDGNGDVTIALPITTDCSATGAVCTGGGKKLSNHIEHTVSGPAHTNSVATGIPTITGTAQMGEDADGGDLGHRGRRRAEQRGLQLPVARRQRGDCRGDQQQLHPGGRRRG